jgi:hypothetical protein
MKSSGGDMGNVEEGRKVLPQGGNKLGSTVRCDV